MKGRIGRMRFERGNTDDDNGGDWVECCLIEPTTTKIHWVVVGFETSNPELTCMNMNMLINNKKKFYEKAKNAINNKITGLKADNKIDGKNSSK